MIKQSENQVNELTFVPTKSIVNILKGTLTAYIFLIAAFCILALLYTYTPMPDKYVEPAVNAITLASLILAGFSASRTIGMLGWLHGAGAGLVHSLIRILLGLAVFKSYVPQDGIAKTMLIAIITSAIGGIIGVNFGKNKRKRGRKSSR